MTKETCLKCLLNEADAMSSEAMCVCKHFYDMFGESFIHFKS